VTEPGMRIEPLSPKLAANDDLRQHQYFSE
jgi:hypothetical protein